jgi:hypothetical protein
MELIDECTEWYHCGIDDGIYGLDPEEREELKEKIREIIE